MSNVIFRSPQVTVHNVGKSPGISIFAKIATEHMFTDMKYLCTQYGGGLRVGPLTWLTMFEYVDKAVKMYLYIRDESR